MEAFGYGTYENARDISALHTAKASEENLELKAAEILPDSYDEHDLHILEHTRYLLSSEFKRMTKKEEVKARITTHIALHKKLKKEE